MRMLTMKHSHFIKSLIALVGCDNPTGGGRLVVTKHENGKTASRGYVAPVAQDGEPVKIGYWTLFWDSDGKKVSGHSAENLKEVAWNESTGTTTRNWKAPSAPAERKASGPSGTSRATSR